MGGLSRRNTIIAQERAHGKSILVAEGGNSLAPVPPLVPPPRPGSAPPPPPPPPSEEELSQRRIKAELVADAWVIGGIDAVAIGAQDWTLGSDWIRDLVAREKLPVLAANLVCNGQSPYPASRVVEVGGHKIGVVGLTAGAPEGCEVTDPVAATGAAVSALGPVEFTLLLAPIDPMVLAKIGEAGIRVDAALTTGGRMGGGPAAPSATIPTFEAGSRGKEVGVVELAFTTPGGRWIPAGQVDAINERIARSEQRLKDLEPRIQGAADDATRARWQGQQHTYETQLARDRETLAKIAANQATNQMIAREIGLGADVADDASTRAKVDAAKVKLEAEIGKVEPDKVAHRMPPGSEWAGSDVCAECHKAEHAQWAGTAHSHALSSLVTAGRVMDPECFSCHVTGFHQEGGPSVPTEIGPFRDVQCEACHGPGRGHVASNGAEELVKVPPASTCTTCHDGDRDGGRFDYAAYLPKISHGVGADGPAR